MKLNSPDHFDIEVSFNEKTTIRECQKIISDLVRDMTKSSVDTLSNPDICDIGIDQLKGVEKVLNNLPNMTMAKKVLYQRKE